MLTWVKQSVLLHSVLKFLFSETVNHLYISKFNLKYIVMNISDPKSFMPWDYYKILKPCCKFLISMVIITPDKFW